MSKKTNIGPISATELMARLNQDPEFVRRSQEQALEFSVRKKRSAEAERPVVRALNDAGIAVNSLSDLVNTKRRYPTAIPVLLDHLVLPYPYPTRESIARALTTREAADGYRVLLDQFRNLADSDDAAQHGFKWALGNAISVVADKPNFDEVVDLVRDKSHGSTRDTMIWRLPWLNPLKAVAVLIDLLNDD